MNIESSKHRFDEITLPSTESLILLQKINAQIIEFNFQGTLASIGCKYIAKLNHYANIDETNVV